MTDRPFSNLIRRPETLDDFQTGVDRTGDFQEHLLVEDSMYLSESRYLIGEFRQAFRSAKSVGDGVARGLDVLRDSQFTKTPFGRAIVDERRQRRTLRRTSDENQCKQSKQVVSFHIHCNSTCCRFAQPDM